MSAARSRLTGSATLRLTALLQGNVAGSVFQMGNGQLAFRYDDEWRSSATAYPLSVSMPLAAAEHGNQATRAFLRGLLPDNPDVVAWWARRYGVSRYRVVDLLLHIGEDCAGVVQFAKPERVDALLGAPTAADEASSIDWLPKEDAEERLRALRLNPAAGRVTGDTGQFSLAGAQPKTALCQGDDGRWGVPTGRTPTNRILKPPTLGLDDFAYRGLGWQCRASARMSPITCDGASVAYERPPQYSFNEHRSREDRFNHDPVVGNWLSPSRSRVRSVEQSAYL